MMDHPLCLQPATELARRIRRKDFSAVELLQAHLDRVARLNPQLNAVVVLQAEVALQRAREADAALARGQLWGPLHGVPMTVKEAFDLTGTPTTWGFEAHRNNIATGDAVAVQRLLQAGAVVFGKTNVPVALADWQTFNPVYGTSNNPWHLGHSPRWLVGRLGRRAGRGPERTGTGQRHRLVDPQPGALLWRVGPQAHLGHGARCKATSCRVTNAPTPPTSAPPARWRAARWI